MECKIYRRGAAVGTMTVEEDGLYRVVHARIPPEPIPVRLFAPERLGVFVPEGNWMVLHRRISRRLLPEMPEFAVALTEAELQWSEDAHGLRHRYTPMGLEHAVRLQCDTPMIFPAAPQQLRLIRIRGLPYLCCTQSYVT